MSTKAGQAQCASTPVCFVYRSRATKVSGSHEEGTDYEPGQQHASQRRFFPFVAKSTPRGGVISRRCEILCGRGALCGVRANPVCCQNSTNPKPQTCTRSCRRTSRIRPACRRPRRGPTLRPLLTSFFHFVTAATAGGFLPGRAGASLPPGRRKRSISPVTISCARSGTASAPATCSVRTRRRIVRAGRVPRSRCRPARRSSSLTQRGGGRPSSSAPPRTRS